MKCDYKDTGRVVVALRERLLSDYEEDRVWGRGVERTLVGWFFFNLKAD